MVGHQHLKLLRHFPCPGDVERNKWLDEMVAVEELELLLSPSD